VEGLEGPAPPLIRRTGGARAEEFWMRARVAEARAADDQAALRSASAELARWLASRDRDLGEAVELATSALGLEEDVELRRELSSWLVGLGEAGRAAAILRPIASMLDVEGTESAYVLSRIGLLKARTGAMAAAASALEAAISVEPGDPVSAEMLGALSSLEPEVVPPSMAAEAYVEGARRRRALQQDDAELEDLWRAVASDESSEAATLALADALTGRGRATAADEVWRAHARACKDDERASRLHAQRFAAALVAQQLPAALGAALDQGLDSIFEGSAADTFDALLLDVGMLEAVAARLEIRASRVPVGPERGAVFVELARLYSGPLADDERSAGAYVSAIASHPANETAWAALGTVIGDRMGDASTVDRSRALRALAESVVQVDTERARRTLLEAKIGPMVPRWSASPATADDGSDSRFTTARAWARAGLSSEGPARPSVLERVAVSAAAPLRAVLLAVASARYMTLGDVEAARRTAELATQADPSSARCVATLADAVRGDRDRPASAALERAIALVGPRYEWCASLAETLDELGETRRAANWTERSVALKPGDGVGIEKLLDRVVRAGDAEKIIDVLVWLLSQSIPTASFLLPFARALQELGRLDTEKGAVVARRALEVFGPKLPVIRATMLELARRAADPLFEAAILERWLSSGVEGPDRRALLATLADLRQRLGDVEGRARIVARTVCEGLHSPEIDAQIFFRADEDAATPDARIWLLTARSEWFGTTPDAQSTGEAAWAWRDLGAALWDLAEDRMGAIAAWQRAARLSPAQGYRTLALDLLAFAGVDFALEYLAQWIDAEPDDATAAQLAFDFARAALGASESRMAFDLAARGVARNPSEVDVLELAEVAAAGANEALALSGLYELVAARSLGRFGRRAAHYRGARYFDRSGEHELALKHAAQAFYAVPSEGSSFQLLARAAEKAGDRSQAVRTVEQVAERADRPDARASWLLRAASIAGPGEEGTRRKVDVLLRATVAAPSVGAIALLTDAARDLLRFGPEERDILDMRMVRAARAVLQRLDGPEGARVAVAFAMVALDLFSDADGAFASFERAFACDPDVDEFTQLLERAHLLATAKGARDGIATMLTIAEDPYANVGIAALRLIASIAAVVGNPLLRARAAVAAAKREVEDGFLIVDADEAVRSFPELAEQLARHVSGERRVEALLSLARERAAEGAYAEAAVLFERAGTLLDGAARTELERELRAALDAAGKSAEIDARVQQEAVSDEATPSTRADRWMEIAERREIRGDRSGAVRAVLEACRLDPEPLHRWSALERLAEIDGDDANRVLALEEIARRVGRDGLVAVFKRLARTHERRSDFEKAEAAWHAVLELDADDEEADQAIESAMAKCGNYEGLVVHLAKRAARLQKRSGNHELLRALRLRRAAILEQRLGRDEDACDELALLLAESPTNVGALRYLADLLERRGDFAQSAPLWGKAAEVELDPGERNQLELKAGLAAREAGDYRGALAHANRVLSRIRRNSVALSLRIEAARALGSDADLGDALEAAATYEPDPSVRSTQLMEAATAAARTGDSTLALGRAQRAAAAAPDRATPQLLARGLEYRHRGPGRAEDARRTIEELGRVTETLGRDDAALRAFLVAEARSVLEGPGAGLQELEAVYGVVGAHALLALGLAERLAACGQDGPAVDAYRVALGGSLLDLRKPGGVAIAAADTAIRAERWFEAAHFVDLADQHEETKTAARQRRALLLEHEAATSRAAQGRARTPSFRPPGAAGNDVRLEDLEAAVRSATTPGERARARLALGRARVGQGDLRAAEPLLWEALADGLLEAGDVLAPLLTAMPERTADLVRLRRQQVMIEPGAVARLESLHAAAIGDDDRVYARAVEHVLRAFDPGAGPLPPPPLAAQPDRPGIFALLVRPSMDAAGEALSLLWDGAMQLFVKDAASYGITGVERVVPGPTSAIARLYEAAMRVLGAPRIPLFLSRAASRAPAAHIALLSPPAVVLSGDVREESPELRFTLGRGISAALGYNVLRLGLPATEGRALVEALGAAFGPPEIGRRVDPRAARLAESFWQIVPARAQRRLQELLGQGSFPDYDELTARAQQSGRRVGMFLAGDFSCAVRALIAESTPRFEPVLSTANLRSMCEELPMLADLLRLAVGREYADARWHAVPPSAQRGKLPSGRFSLF
jgi:tetratricopeptide (TPR) repeat protein